MLGYVMADRRGEVDALLLQLGQELLAAGWAVSGVVQVNHEVRAGRACDMDLRVLGHDHVVRISQDLGPHARGCRLDTAALEQAVGFVDAALDCAPVLLIVNKFGKSEAEGRGFRNIIGRALSAGVPVLTGVAAAQLDAFRAFSAGMAESVTPDPAALHSWCIRARSTKHDWFCDCKDATLSD